MAFLDFDKKSWSAIIFIVALCCFVPFLGLSHLFDWDEINFAEAAREMLVTGEFSYVQINFKPFWEKPPLFIWMQALSMHLFGVNEFAARLPNAICGGLTLVTLFNIGKNLFSTRFGLLWILVYVGSILPHFYFRSGIIDPWFNLFIFLGIHQLIIASKDEVLNRKRLLSSALFISLAVMTKGPTALGVVGICCAIYFIVNFKSHKWKVVDPVFYIGTVLVLGFSWFLLEIARGRGYIVQEFIDYHIRLLAKGEAGHAQPFYYHPIVLLIGCFPMSLFFIYSWFSKGELTEPQRKYKQWMSILFWVVLVAFSIVKTKIVHYSSLTYFPMSFLATIGIWHLFKQEWKFKPIHQLPLLLFIAILGSAFVLVGMLDSIKEPLLEFIKNSHSNGDFSQSIPDKWFEPLIGLAFMITTMGSVFFILLGKSEKGIIGLFGSTFITVWLLALFVAPKIDRYTQEPLFNFYKEKAGKAYLHPMHSSYAHLFYGKREQWNFVPEDEGKWLLYDQKLDKPAYFIVRLQDLKKTYHYFPFLKEIDRRGGYVILERADKNYPFSTVE